MQRELGGGTGEKTAVAEFWNRASCGEIYAEGESPAEQYEAQRQARRKYEPYIEDFARFHEGRGKDVLEIGVGMGADHAEWAMSSPRSLIGVDLTPRAIEHTRTRLAHLGLASDLRIGDAEALDFPEDSFDVVYSWGVLHHSPNTETAFREVRRVLRPGGVARIMVYHTHSITGYMLWLRYALMTGQPTRSLADVYAHHLESPGTKAYTVEEARELCRDFRHSSISTQLCPGDLLQGQVGARHRGPLLAVAKRLWPRRVIERYCTGYGLCLLIEAHK